MNQPRDDPEGDALRLLECGEIRARRRPRALVFVWGWELVCGLLIATPVHAWARAVFDAHPDGDAPLFRVGGYALMSWLGDDSTALAVVIRTTLFALLVIGVLGQLVTGSLLAALASGVGRRGAAPPTVFMLRAGAAAFFPLLGVGVVAGAISVFLGGLGLFLGITLVRALDASVGDARAFDVGVGAFALFVVLALLAGVIADLMRAALASASTAATIAGASGSARNAAAGAARRIRHALGPAILGWSWRAALSLALLYAGARAGDVVGERDGIALWLLFGFHQLVVFARAGLRASWLANALRLVARKTEPEPAPDDETAEAV